MPLWSLPLPHLSQSLALLFTLHPVALNTYLHHSQNNKKTKKTFPLHKQKNLAKAAKREINALSRISKNKSIIPSNDPDEFQWQLLFADQKKRKEEVESTTILQERTSQAVPDASHVNEG